MLRYLACLALLVAAASAAEFERWSPVASTNGIGPDSVSAGSMASDGRNLWVFGGHHENFISAFNREITFNNNLWKFDTFKRKWTAIEAANGPSERAFIRSVYSHRTKKVYIYGGITFDSEFSNGAGFSGFWTYTPRSNTWEHIPLNIPDGDPTPGPRGGYEAILREKNGSVKIYIACGVGPGPFGFEFLNDVWEYDVLDNEWTQLQSLPSARQALTGGWLQHGDKLVLYGGEGFNFDTFKFEFNREVWTLELGQSGPAAPTWELIDDGLGALAPQGEDATAGGAWGSNFYIYGGDGSDGSTNCGAPYEDFSQDIVDTTWRWDDRTATWKELDLTVRPPPLKRAMFTVSEPYLYVVGGFDFQDPATWPEDTFCGQVFNNDVYRLRIAPVAPWWNFWGWWVGFGGAMALVGGGGAMYARRKKKSVAPETQLAAVETADIEQTA